jgi:DNA topoisomerase-2
MVPWWQSFEGTVEKVDDAFEIYGKWKIVGNKLIITELPVGEGTSNYKAFLEGKLEVNNGKEEKKGVNKYKSFLGYTSNNTDTKVYFELTFEDGYLEKTQESELVKLYHLVSKCSLTNMHAFNAKGQIRKYKTVDDIIKDYYDIRLEFYEKRKEYQLDILEHQLNLLSWKVKFISMVIDKKIEINNKKKSEIEEKLESKKFPQLSATKDSKPSYDYLLSMPIYNLTFEKIEELKKQQENKQSEYDDLKSKSVETIWLEELESLKEQYIHWMESKQNNNSTVSKKKSKK